MGKPKFDLLGRPIINEHDSLEQSRRLRAGNTNENVSDKAAQENLQSEKSSTRSSELSPMCVHKKKAIFHTWLSLALLVVSIFTVGLPILIYIASTMITIGQFDDNKHMTGRAMVCGLGRALVIFALLAVMVGIAESFHSQYRAEIQHGRQIEAMETELWIRSFGSADPRARRATYERLEELYQSAE